MEIHYCIYVYVLLHYIYIIVCTKNVCFFWYEMIFVAWCGLLTCHDVNYSAEGSSSRKGTIFHTHFSSLISFTLSSLIRDVTKWRVTKLDYRNRTLKMNERRKRLYISSHRISSASGALINSDNKKLLNDKNTWLICYIFIFYIYIILNIPNIKRLLLIVYFI